MENNRKSFRHNHWTILVIISTITILIIIGVENYQKKQKELSIIHDDFINSINSNIVNDLNYYISFSIDGPYESELIITCENGFDELSLQQKYNYLDSCLKFCNIYDDYRTKMNYPITIKNLGTITVVTEANQYSISSVGTFSENGVANYELQKQNNNTNTQNYDSGLSPYSVVQGVNGQYTYRCTKMCSDKCGKGCDSCLLNGKSFSSGPKCCFSYGASKQIGWVGCPDCGDISSEEWFKWYRNALGLD